MANFDFASVSVLGAPFDLHSAQFGSAQLGVRFDLARGSAIRSGHIARSIAPGSVRLGS